MKHPEASYVPNRRYKLYFTPHSPAFSILSSTLSLRNPLRNSINFFFFPN